jgi:hypothetical protein
VMVKTYAMIRPATEAPTPIMMKQAQRQPSGMSQCQSDAYTRMLNS